MLFAITCEAPCRSKLLCAVEIVMKLQEKSAMDETELKGRRVREGGRRKRERERQSEIGGREGERGEQREREVDIGLYR